MTSPVLKTEKLSYSYDEGVLALNEVSFSVEEGEYVCVIGHNGSGKSTLAKAILGLLGGFDGEIILFGEQLTKKTLRSLRARMGIVFQNPDNQFIGSTVADDIAFGLENKCIPQKDMQAIIEDVAVAAGMEKFLDKEPQSLSGGQKQRVAIAGVLAMQPDLVIFDEATAMLDPKGKREIADLIQKTKQKNPSLTIVSITHDVEEAAMADRVLVMNNGQLVLQGKPQEVFAQKEKLEEIRLGVPYFYLLKKELERVGIVLPDEITTLEEAEDYLCR